MRRRRADFVFGLLLAAMMAAAVAAPRGSGALASEARQPPPPTEPGFLGVLLQAVDEDLARAVGLDRPRGAYVARVLDGSPADRDGIRDGDVILEIEGVRVADRAACIGRISSTRPGTRVQVAIFRDREQTVVDVTIGRRPESLAKR